MLAVLVLALGALSVSALALVHVLSAWAVLFFYVVPGLAFTLWGLRALSPAAWRSIATPLRRRWRTSRLCATPVRRADLEPAGARPALALPWLRGLRFALRLERTAGARRWLNLAFGVCAVAIAVEAGRKLATRGWPLGHVDATLIAASCAFFLTSVVLKSVGWQLLFRRAERPDSLNLAAATGAAAVAGLALPGRLDDALRVAIVRKMPGRRPGVATLVVSLFLLGLIDAAALTPLAAVAAAVAPLELGTRIALAVVAGAGAGATIVLSLLPRLQRRGRLSGRGVSHWLGRHAPSSGRDAVAAGGIVTLSWAVRATGVFVLLRGLGFALSFPIALAYLSAGSASAALPIGPAGAATQAGVGAAALGTAGVSPARAVAFALLAQGLIVVSGGAIALFAAAMLSLRRVRLA
jgi:uncharacterized membrane protein YbhN (UPF0104 family)